MTPVEHRPYWRLPDGYGLIVEEVDVAAEVEEERLQREQLTAAREDARGIGDGLGL